MLSVKANFYKIFTLEKYKKLHHINFFITFKLTVFATTKTMTVLVAGAPKSTEPKSTLFVEFRQN